MSNDLHKSDVIGRHLVADLSGISQRLLLDPDEIMAALDRAVCSAGYRVVDRLTHVFSEFGCGFTGVLILAQSHAIIHTYPEESYLALDIFGCGTHDPHLVVKQLIDELAPQSACTRELVRLSGSSQCE